MLVVLGVTIGAFVFLRQRKLIGRFQNVYGKSQDIKKRYTQLVHLLPQTVIELDKDGIISFLNEAGKTFFEIETYDLKKGINIHDLIIKDHRDRFHEDYLYLLEGGLNKGQEYLIRSLKGKQYSITIYFSAIYNDGALSGIRGIIIDISRSKKLEREALSAVMDTEERERKRFSEDLHDGLGPLLSTIKLYINQLNSENKLDSDAVELLKFTNDLIDESISTTRNIANNILPGSIIDNGLWSAVLSFCQKIEQTGTMKFNLVNSFKPRIRKNVESNLYRIIIELINNTIKHAKANIINISIDLVDDELRFTYSDNGIGLSSEISNGMGMINIKNRSAALNGQYHIFNSGGMRFELNLPMLEIIEKGGD